MVVIYTTCISLFIQNYFVTIFHVIVLPSFFNNGSTILYGLRVMVERVGFVANLCVPLGKAHKPFWAPVYLWNEDKMYVKHIVQCLTLDKPLLWFITWFEPCDIAFMVCCFENGFKVSVVCRFVAVSWAVPRQLFSFSRVKMALLFVLYHFIGLPLKDRGLFQWTVNHSVQWLTTLHSK